MPVAEANIAGQAKSQLRLSLLNVADDANRRYRLPLLAPIMVARYDTNPSTRVLPLARLTGPSPLRVPSLLSSHEERPFNYVPPVAGQERLPPADYSEPGRIGDPDSWVTAEFELDYGLGMMNAQHAYARGLTGAGIRLGLRDDGVEFRHSEFAGKNNAGLIWADFLEDGTRCQAPVRGADVILSEGCFYTDGGVSRNEYFVRQADDVIRANDGNPVLVRVGHGTHVAATMAGNRDLNGAHGVAFGADIVSAKAWSDRVGNHNQLVVSYGGFPSAFCDAFPCTSHQIFPTDEAIADIYEQFIDQGVEVINNSWGFVRRNRTVEDLDAWVASQDWMAEYLGLIGDRTSEEGILQVWSAGNNAGDVAGATATAPRYRPQLEPYWISVANINADEEISPGSSICGASMNWCVAAAGTVIWSAQFGAVIDYDPGAFEPILNDDGHIIGYRQNGEIPTTNAFQTSSGTSMAAPHVSGALALLFERFPYLESTAIRDILLTTARDIGAEGVDEIYGWGIPDLQRAIEGPGQLIKDINVVMNERAGGEQVWEGDAWDDWTNDISGVGRLTKGGIGWLRLSGDNSFNGLTVTAGTLELAGSNALGRAVDVTGGTFLLNGSLEGTDLNITGGEAVIGLHGFVSAPEPQEAGEDVPVPQTDTNVVTQTGHTSVGELGALRGTGTLASTTVNGMITPGLALEDMGQLNVVGTYVQGAGSVFNVAVRPVDQAGLLNVTGTADLQGGTVKVLALPGLYQLDQSFKILSASEGVTGEFEAIEPTGLDLPFLAFMLDHQADAVAVNVTRGASFLSFATTFNERAVAGSIDALSNDSALLNDLSQLSGKQATTLYTHASGELHASIQGALADSGRMIREAALHRGAVRLPDDQRGFQLWGDVRFEGGARGTDRNAARVTQDGHAFLMGGEVFLGNAFRVGIFGGVGKTDVRTRQLGSAQADNLHFGGYAAGNWGGFNLAAGMTYSRHDVETARSIASSSPYDQSLTAKYHVKLHQHFAEAGYQADLGAATVGPFLRYTNLRLSHDEIRERGGSLAVTGKVDTAKLDIGTFGIRFQSQAKNADGTPHALSVNGSIGYRKLWGDRLPLATFSWTESGGLPYTIAGLAAEDDAIATDLGVSARIGKAVSLHIGYSGEFAGRNDNHTGNARISISF